MRINLPCLLATTVLTSATSAQIPPGDSLWSARSPGGWEIVDLRNGSTTWVEGISPFDLGAIHPRNIDPIDGSILATDFVGFPEFGHVVRASLSGSTIVTQEILYDAGPNVAIGGVDYDRDGNLFIAVSPVFNTGVGSTGVYRIDGQTGQATLWASAYLPDTKYQNLAIDDTTNTLWVLLDQPSLLDPTLLLKSPVGSSPSWTEAVAIASNNCDGLDTDENGNCYFSDETDAYHHFSDSTGLLTTVSVNSSLGFGEDPTWLAYDARNDTVHVVTRGDGEYHVFNPPDDEGTKVLDNCEIGSPFTVVVNDFLDQTTVFPKTISVSQNTELRASMHGQSGEIAAVFVAAIKGGPIAPIFVGSPGTCDAGGFLPVSTSLSANSLPAGLTLTVQGGRIDNVTGAVVLGTAVDVVTVP